MKKILFTTSTIITLLVVAITFGFGQFGLNPKKMACEKACTAAYDQCKELAEKTTFDKCMEAAGKIQDAGKKKAGEVGCTVTKEASLLGCKKGKDECNAKCN